MSSTTTTTTSTRRFFPHPHRSKSPRPAPITTSSATSTSTTSTNNTNPSFTSSTTTSSLPFLHTGNRTNSPPPYVTSPTTFHSPTTTTTTTASTHPAPTMHKRHFSNPHRHSKRKSSGSSTSSYSDYKRLSGTLNHCGRHGNDWLFGGFSVRESVGKLWHGSEAGSDAEEDGVQHDGRGGRI